MFATVEGEGERYLRLKIFDVINAATNEYEYITYIESGPVWS